MPFKVMSLALLTGALTLTTLGLINAQSPVPSQNPSHAPYRPGLGDLMTMTVQPRHIKLGIAGQQKNWVYAAYALRELEESFERAAEAWPVYRTTNIAEVLEASMKEPMEAISRAIKSADSARFSEAYARLTATCNACHQATDRAFVVIQAPASSPFPDQDFRPVRP